MSSPVTPEPGVAPAFVTGYIELANNTATVRTKITSFFGLHDNFADISTSIRFVKYRDHIALDLVPLKQKCDGLPSWETLSYSRMEYLRFSRRAQTFFHHPNGNLCP